ncbi:putative bifunctional diguanylate cyclase/phosphodiesterase [Angustibacter sp. McL0619]|uniref:putative bifunctional diguanylate cyclase/phosphodiesterase n=1 Tax=Angustibacter sp. McL0619 TaxID=3415676 RepID=UPI003CF297DA
MSLEPGQSGSDGAARGTNEMLEPVVPLLLSAVGVVSCATVGAGPLTMLLTLIPAVLGLAGLLGWRGDTALLVRACMLAGTAYTLPLVDHALVPHVLQWWYAIVAVYPLLLVALGTTMAFTLAGAVLSQYLVGTATTGVTLTGWALRCLLLAGIGVLVARAGTEYRSARDDARRRQVAAEAAERELHHATTHDALTGMPNRTSLDLFLDVALHARTDEPDHEVALLLLDMDRFKNVNETLGHLAGDRLLREVGDRLINTLDDDQRAARLGGDEFAVVLTRATPAQAQLAAERLVELFDQPVEVGGAPYRIGVSVGVATTGNGIEERSDLLRCADAAMYAAKRGGRGRAVAFDSAMSEDVAANLAVEQQLREAIALGADLGPSRRADAITAVFQPVVSLATGRAIGAEALARWELGGRFVTPLRFVPLAEELGLGRELAVVIARQSMQALSAWHRDGYTEIGSIAINISAADLLSPGLPDELAGIVSGAGLSPGALTLEITERDVVGDVERTRETMQELRHKGITVAVDDFGTGFSSLAYLARLPLQVLKIDREFVANLHDDDTIARTVVGLAGSFGMECIAEGIETEQQLLALSELGVHAGQGWHLGRPTSAADFVESLRALTRTG